MKRKLICMLTLLCICIASLASAVVVSAEAFTVPDDYNVSSGIVVDSHEAGGVISASNISHGLIVEMRLGGAMLNETEHKYIHLKAKVSANLYRIKFNYAVVGGSTVTLYSRLIDTTGASDVGVVVDENGVFEYHGETPAEFIGVELEKLAFQLYVDGGSTTETIQFLGVVFNAEETYTDFAQPGEPSVPDEPEVPAVGAITAGEWQDESAGNMQFSAENGKTTIHFPTEPSSKSRIYFSVEGHKMAEYPQLRIAYSSTKAFNFSVYGNGTSESLLYYTNMEAGDHDVVIDLDRDLTSIYIMVDRSGKHDPATYPAEDPTKTVYLEFYLVDANGAEVMLMVGGGEAPEQPDVPDVPTGELAFGAMAVVGEKATVEGNKATYATAEESSIDSLVGAEGEAYTYLTIPVSNWDFATATQVSIKYATSGVTGIGMHVLGQAAGAEAYAYVANVLPAGWNTTTVSYDEAGFIVSTSSMGDYLLDFTSVSAIIIKVQAEVGATFELLDITATADGEHGFEVPLGAMQLSDIVIPNGFEATLTKGENGEQTITYSTDPGWNTFDITVTNYDANNFIFEAVFEATADTAVCFSINDKVDWSIGHKLYPGERTSTQQIDVSSYSLPANFTIKIYLDAEKVDVTAEKSVTFKSITFKTPDPEPEGMYIGTPTASAMTCMEGALGWDVKWTYEGSWSSVKFPVNNFDTEYDILVVRMSAVAGMNLGVRILWQEEVEGELIELHDDIRNHWAEEGLVTETGDMELVFFMEAFAIKGKVITGFTLYFDPPTGNYTPNEGEQNAKIYSAEFLKASEQDFEDLTITANAMTTDFNGEPVEFVATNDQDVALVVEYLGSEENASWTTSAPSNAGEYQVRVTYMGSLAYNYQVVTSTLTINKVKATVTEADVVIDAESKIVTVAEGVIASKDADFIDGFEVLTGDEIAYGTTIYFKRPEDVNHTESDVMSITFTRPAPQPNSSSPVVSVPEVPSSSTGELSGCASSVATMGMAGFAVLASAVVVFLRKRK